MQSPEPFAGELEKCTGFLAQLSLFFASRAYASDDAWIAFFAQLLWNHALQKTHLNISYPKFLFKFKGVFKEDVSPVAAAQCLLNLKQGKCTMAHFSIDFRFLAVETE